MRSFADWLPIHIIRSTPRPEVLWSRLGPLRFSDPFFTQTVGSALRSPLAKLLQRTTSIEELVGAAEREEAVEPAGFIFHVSRCGSTLVAQMFAQLPRLITISEAHPLMTASDDPRLSPADRARVFRALVRLYGRRSSGNEIASVFKFGLRELLQWRAIAEWYPNVPRAVLFRDPIEVLVSNLATLSEATLPGHLSLGESPQPLRSNDDYAAFALSRIYACAAEVARAPGSLAVNYTELPAAVESRIAPHFGIKLNESDCAAMRVVTRLHAKDASRATEFTPDSEAKRAEATPAAREWVAKYFQESYRELLARSEAKRSSDL